MTPSSTSSLSVPAALLEDVPAKALHDPKKLAKAVERLEVDYPEPIVEHKVARERAIDTFKAVRADA